MKKGKDILDFFYEKLCWMVTLVILLLLFLLYFQRNKIEILFHILLLPILILFLLINNITVTLFIVIVLGIIFKNEPVLLLFILFLLYSLTFFLQKIFEKKINLDWNIGRTFLINLFPFCFKEYNLIFFPLNGLVFGIATNIIEKKFFKYYKEANKKSNIKDKIKLSVLLKYYNLGFLTMYIVYIFFKFINYM